MTWQHTVRSWGLAPLYGVMCRGMGWKMGQACARCQRCAESPDRPSDGANVDNFLINAQERIEEVDLEHYRKLATAGRSTR